MESTTEVQSETVKARTTLCKNTAKAEVPHMLSDCSSLMLENNPVTGYIWQCFPCYSWSSFTVYYTGRICWKSCITQPINNLMLKHLMWIQVKSSLVGLWLRFPPHTLHFPQNFHEFCSKEVVSGFLWSSYIWKANALYLNTIESFQYSANWRND